MLLARLGFVHGSFSKKVSSMGRKIEDMQKLAEKRGGKCLSTEYAYTKLEWECDEGHTWLMTE